MRDISHPSPEGWTCLTQQFLLIHQISPVLGEALHQGACPVFSSCSQNPGADPPFSLGDAEEQKGKSKHRIKGVSQLSLAKGHLHCNQIIHADFQAVCCISFLPERGKTMMWFYISFKMLCPLNMTDIQHLKRPHRLHTEWVTAVDTCIKDTRVSDI